MAMQPVDYTLKGVQAPIEAMTQGYQLGSGIRSNELAMQQAQQKMQQEQQQMQQRAMQQKALSDFLDMENPTARDVMRVSAMLPKDQAEMIGKSFEGVSKERIDNELKFGGQVMSALELGNPQAASDLLSQRAKALRNSGDEQQAKMYDIYAQSALENPSATYKTLSLTIAASPGGKDVIESIAKRGEELRSQEMATAKQSEQESKAKIAAANAKFADSLAAKELEKKGYDIQKIQNDIQISKENAKIAAANTALTRETNELRKKELEQKIEDMKMKRDDLVREKTSNLESAKVGIDSLVDSVDKILSVPEDVMKAAMGPVDQILPTFQQDVADFEALVEGLDAKAFMAQIPMMKGSGALSDSEGKKLSSSLANLSLKQSPKQFMESLRSVKDIMTSARNKLADKYGVPEVTQQQTISEDQASGLPSGWSVTVKQ